MRCDLAGPLLAVFVGTSAAALISVWGGGGDFPGLPGLWDTALRAQPAPADVPVYTNDDLERVRPLRGETGVTSQPAFAPGAGAGRVDGCGRKRRGGPAESCDAPGERAGRAAAPRGEAYWRREAERVRAKLRLWRDQVEDLEIKIAERRRKPGVRPYSDPQIGGWERRAAALRARMRELEGDLDDRARRERALPGWLR